MNIYDRLQNKTDRIVMEGLKLSRRPKTPSDYCVKKCVSCLAAEARGNIDEKDFGIGFDSREDICLLEARDILAEKLKSWKVK